MPGLLLRLSLGLPRLALVGVGLVSVLAWAAMMSVGRDLAPWITSVVGLTGRIALTSLVAALLGGWLSGSRLLLDRSPGSSADPWWSLLVPFVVTVLAVAGFSAVRPLASLYAEAWNELATTGILEQLRRGMTGEMGLLVVVPAMPAALVAVLQLAPAASLALSASALLATWGHDARRLGPVLLATLAFQGAFVADAVFVRDFSMEGGRLARPLLDEIAAPSGQSPEGRWIATWLGRHQAASNRSVMEFAWLLGIQLACIPILVAQRRTRQRYADLSFPDTHPAVQPAHGEPPTPQAHPLAPGRDSCFLRRAQALAIDLVLVYLVSVLAAGVIWRMRTGQGLQLNEWSGDAGWGLVFLVLLPLSWLYWAGMESSPWQATFGKRLVRIRVADLEGHPVSFARASLRHAMRLVSALLWGLGFLVALVTARGQALHDLFAGTVILDDVPR